MQPLGVASSLSKRCHFYVALTRTTETLVLSSVTYKAPQLGFQMGVGAGGEQVQT